MRSATGQFCPIVHDGTYSRCSYTLGGPAADALRGSVVIEALADRITAIFRVTGVREYAKSRFPTKAIYGATDYAALRLITCGGTFDYATGHYLSSTIVFASLTSSRAARGRGGG